MTKNTTLTITPEALLEIHDQAETIYSNADGNDRSALNGEGGYWELLHRLSQVTFTPETQRIVDVVLADYDLLTDEVRREAAEELENPYSISDAVEEAISAAYDTSEARRLYEQGTATRDMFQEMQRRQRAWVEAWGQMQDPDLKSDVLAALATSDDPRVLGTVAQHAQTSEATLRMLANSDEVRVRRAVACNKRTPADALEYLVADENDWVRDAVRGRDAADTTLRLKLMIALVKCDDSYHGHPARLQEAVAAILEDDEDTARGEKAS